ncbi:MAG: RnfABCDGE type electron transport complex subunit D [Bacillota bacterium]
MTTEQFIVTPPPHLKEKDTVSSAMRDVGIALIPVSVTALYFFRLNALFLMVVCLLAAAITDIVVRALRGRHNSLRDGSALLTGFLVALTYSPTGSWWLAVLATVIGVGLAKELMGGLGWNRFNPALFGRVSIIILGPLFVLLNREFAGLAVRFPMVDAITQATPMALLKQGLPGPGYLSLFLANAGGALGETSALALLLGGAYLLYRGHISWRTPVSCIAAVFVLTAVFGRDPLFHVLAGGLLLGAIFMATDWVTSPITERGQIIYGVSIGVLVVVFRLFLAPVEGVAFSILIMNAFVPMIDKATRRLTFGEVPALPATGKSETA